MFDDSRITDNPLLNRQRKRYVPAQITDNWSNLINSSKSHILGSTIPHVTNP